MFDLDTATDFQTANFDGCQLEWCGEPYDSDFGIQVRAEVLSDYAMDVHDFFADYVADPPAGAVYFDGYLIVHTYADMVALMRTMQDRYNTICNYVNAASEKGWY